MAEQSQITPDLVQAFRHDDRAATFPHFKAACLLGIVLMPAGIVLDFFVYPEHLMYFFLLRVACSVVIGALLAVVSSTPSLVERHRAMGLLLATIPPFFISWMILETEGSASPYYAGLNLVMLITGFVLSWTIRESVIAVVAVIAMYVGACSLHGSFVHPGIFGNNMYFLVLTGVIMVVGSYFHQRLRFREFALRWQLEQNRKTIEDKNRKLIELDQAKSRFFAAISHELRTPLTLMLSPLDTLRTRFGRLMDAHGLELLDSMKSNGLRLLRLINDLLDLVRLEEGRAQVERSVVAVPEFVRGIISSVQHTAQARGVSLLALVDGAPPKAMLDRDKLERILLNLVFNALKFTNPGGGVVVEVTSTGEAMEFRVTDTGIGIAEVDQRHLFQRFWQADGSASRKQPGTGIGLALVKELTEIQGGTVLVESELGKGTRFTVRLPLILPEAGEASPAGEAAPPSGSGKPGEVTAGDESWLRDLYRQAQHSPGTVATGTRVGHPVLENGAGPHWVLVADDEPDMLRFISRELAEEHRVLTAVNGRAALQLALAHRPSLIVLDMMMPEMDGIGVCRALRKEASTEHIPVIMLTARADEETKLTALEAGASDFLAKPFSVTELRVRVRNLIETQDSRQELARQNQALETALEQLREVEMQLIQSEKLASLGELSAGMSHEVKNPLNYSLTGLYALKQRATDLPEADRGDYEALVASVEEGLHRVLDTVNALRELVHPHVGHKHAVNLHDAVDTALRLLGSEIKGRIRTEVQVDPALNAHGNKSMLLLVLMNLLKNAADALNGAGPGRPAPIIQIQAQSEGDCLRLSVRDNGPGISPEHQARVYDILGMGDRSEEMAEGEAASSGRVFKHFFTTKESGAGMGLGLGICRRIVRAHGGRISFRSEPGSGCEFVVELPLAEELEVAA